MKTRLLFLSLLFLCLTGKAQWKDYMIGARGDTLNAIDMNGQKQGRWVIRLESVRGEPGYEEEGQFKNDKKEGAWRVFNLSGDLIGMEHYRWGNRDGNCRYFTMNGDLIREEGWKAVNPDNPYDTILVPDINSPEKDVFIKTVVKLEGTSLKHGNWKTFEPGSGRTIKVEMYVLGKLYKDEPKPDIDPETGKERVVAAPPPKPKAVPKEVADYEKKFKNKKHKERDGRTGQ
jgi:hypothetical protein